MFHQAATPLSTQFSMVTVIVAFVVSGVLIRLYYILCRRLPSQPVAPAAAENDDAYLAMFSVAHDDIWWAKEHAWTVVIAALAILVAVLLVDFSNKPPHLLDFLSGALLLLTAASNLYVGRMQSDMAVARIRSAFVIQRCATLSAVVNEVVAADLTHYNRGSGFMVVLLLLTSAVGGIALSVLRGSPNAGLVAYLILFGLGLASLFLQVKYRAAREKALTRAA